MQHIELYSTICYNFEQTFATTRESVQINKSSLTKYCQTRLVDIASKIRTDFINMAGAHLFTHGYNPRWRSHPFANTVLYDHFSSPVESSKRESDHPVSSY